MQGVNGWNTATILLFFDNSLIFYQAFDMNLTFTCCSMIVAEGAYTIIRHGASI